MKNVILVAVFLLTAWVGQEVYAQQGFGTNSPDKSAAVDIVSSKRGLLIPRVALTATNSNALASGQITEPANSLFVYNTATAGAAPNAVTPGYYYWQRDDTSDPLAWQGKWVRFVSSEDVKTTKVEAGENVKVEENTVGNETTYTVGVKASATAGQVLVTQMGDHDGDSGTPDQLMTVWVNPNTFVEGVNGITTTLNPTTNKVEVGLGGSLAAGTTTIATSTGNTDPADDSKLAITGLETVTTYDKIMVLGPGGVLQAADLSSLVQADNGLKIGAASTPNEGKVILGGTLNEVTEIVTDATNTLAIAGLQATNEANKIVVAADAGGVLQTVTRSLSKTTTASMTVNDTDVSGYNGYVQEINIAATLQATGDINITLPSASTSNGQVINVKITNTTDAHAGYLNIFDPTDAVNPLTYGALPYQGWVLKSNGASWLIVGRN